MKAIRFNATIPRYALGLALGKLSPSLLWSGLSCTFVSDEPPPPLPAGDWVSIRTRYGGICGSDLNTIHLHNSPYYSPLTSFPFTFGHENVGTIAAIGPNAGDWQIGQRVIVEPLLWCKPRGFDDLCDFCAAGLINQCERFTGGDLPPGLFTGSCQATGGSWSEHFVAHTSQLYPVPDSISDENALMVEPFACGLHAALLGYPADNETVLVLGAGTIGLCTLAALRQLGSQAHILVLARYPFQAEAARRLGASEVITSGRGEDHLAAIAQRTGASLAQPMLGKRLVLGGVDRTFECVGSDSALDDSLRLTRSGGQVMLVGVPGLAKGIDWSSIFLQELDVRAAFTYHHAETFAGRQWSTFELALHWMAQGQLDLGWMVTHRFALEEYAQAFRASAKRGRQEMIKAVFSFES